MGTVGTLSLSEQSQSVAPANPVPIPLFEVGTDGNRTADLAQARAAAGEKGSMVSAFPRVAWWPPTAGFPGQHDHAPFTPVSRARVGPLFRSKSG